MMKQRMRSLFLFLFCSAMSFHVHAGLTDKLSSLLPSKAFVSRFLPFIKAKPAVDEAKIPAVESANTKVSQVLDNPKANGYSFYKADPKLFEEFGSIAEKLSSSPAVLKQFLSGHGHLFCLQTEGSYDERMKLIETSVQSGQPTQLMAVLALHKKIRNSKKTFISGKWSWLKKAVVFGGSAVAAVAGFYLLSRMRASKGGSVHVTSSAKKNLALGQQGDSSKSNNSGEPNPGISIGQESGSQLAESANGPAATTSVIQVNTQPLPTSSANASADSNSLARSVDSSTDSGEVGGIRDDVDITGLQSQAVERRGQAGAADTLRDPSDETALGATETQPQAEMTSGGGHEAEAEALTPKDGGASDSELPPGPESDQDEDGLQVSEPFTDSKEAPADGDQDGSAEAEGATGEGAASNPSTETQTQAETTSGDGDVTEDVPETEQQGDGDQVSVDTGGSDSELPADPAEDQASTASGDEQEAGQGEDDLQVSELSIGLEETSAEGAQDGAAEVEGATGEGAASNPSDEATLGTTEAQSHRGGDEASVDAGNPDKLPTEPEAETATEKPASGTNAKPQSQAASHVPSTPKKSKQARSSSTPTTQPGTPLQAGAGAGAGASASMTPSKGASRQNSKKKKVMSGQVLQKQVQDFFEAKSSEETLSVWASKNNDDKRQNAVLRDLLIAAEKERNSLLVDKSSAWWFQKSGYDSQIEDAKKKIEIVKAMMRPKHVVSSAPIQVAAEVGGSAQKPKNTSPAKRRARKRKLRSKRAKAARS